MVSDANVILVLLSIVVLLSIILAVFGCVCGCRKTVPKNELMGLAGMVKLTNPDENVNFSSPPPPVVQLNSVAVTADHLVSQASEINKRPNNTVSSATRSLPDLPVESQRLNATRSVDVLWENTEPNGDTSSELYATVDDNKTGRGGRRNPELPRDSTIESSYDSPSQTDNSLSPYARVKREHPYDQVKQNEHPYAQVRTNGKPGYSSNMSDPVTQPTPSSSSSDDIEGPVAPPRTRKSISLSQSSLGSAIDIPAATAIAGGIPANHELPYMTPPIPSSSTASHAQQHFSGDSQDSSKGYTSISVREPLSNIMSQVPRRQELVDSHYATVSDDSDEMYAAIEEPNQSVYTSGSETYAQIRPTTSAGSNPPPPRTESLQPPPPTNQHTRQESSSSAGSSNASPASPKPEKRQANSPLPRPPDPSHLNPAVDEMYAKVMKKRRSSHSVSSLGDPLPTTIPGYEIVQRSQSPQESSVTVPGYEAVVNNESADVDMCSVGYETVAGEHDSLVPGYERVSDLPSDSDPNYEELKPNNVAYAVVNKKRKKTPFPTTEPDYASLSRKDAGYERVDPNYESVSRDSISDPNYESVEREDPPYERVLANNSTYVPVYQQETVEQKEDMYSQVNKQRTMR